MSVKITLELKDADQARAMYKMAQRFCYSHGQQMADSPQQCNQILDGVTRLQDALTDAGYSAR